MSNVDSRSPNHAAATFRSSSTPWILNAPFDLLLIVSTPLLIVPIMLFAQSAWVGIEIETISILVLAFGALGHHFPGMIRAYCDRELFTRFRLRFILSPLLLFAGFFPLYFYHPSAIKLILSTWGCWHGLMQLYGFVRIYDAKVGANSAITSNLDWLLCLSGFSTAQIVSPAKISVLMANWYDLGGPILAPTVITWLRTLAIVISLATLIAFFVNHIIQCIRGPSPNPIKLILLLNGIGLWWIAMVFVDNLILGLAIFEVFHDIQYLTIVWLFNCRRVNTHPQIGTVMRFVFRRGMLALYLGLVLCYGLVGLVPRFAHDDSIKVVFTGLLWTSTILHYYYDGFIWKVRDRLTRTTLGLSVDSSRLHEPQAAAREWTRFLKWSPAIGGIGWLLFLQLTGPPLSASTKERLFLKYTQQLLESSVLPAGKDEQSWLFMVFERVQNIASAVPGDPATQQRAAILLANFGRKSEAIDVLNRSLIRNPHISQNSLAIGSIWYQLGQIDPALASYRAALKNARTREERKIANHRIGEVCTINKQYALAKAHFQAALDDEAAFKPSRLALQRLEGFERIHGD